MLLFFTQEHAQAKTRQNAKPRGAHASAGGASWYGHTFHGRITANGEVYNQYALTAAHKTLPFGHVIRVRNTRNGKETLLRVNDRGPYIRGRVVDVSYRGARALGMTHSGVAPVSFTVVSNKRGEPLVKGNAYYVHVEDAPSMQAAQQRASELGRSQRQSARVLPGAGGVTAVCLGPYSSFTEAQNALLHYEGNIMTAETRRQRNPHATVNGPRALGIMEASANAGSGVRAAEAGSFDADCGQSSLTERMFCTMRKRMETRQ